MQRERDSRTGKALQQFACEGSRWYPTHSSHVKISLGYTEANSPGLWPSGIGVSSIQVQFPTGLDSIDPGEPVSLPFDSIRKVYRRTLPWRRVEGSVTLISGTHTYGSEECDRNMGLTKGNLQPRWTVPRGMHAQFKVEETLVATACQAASAQTLATDVAPVGIPGPYLV